MSDGLLPREFFARPALEVAADLLGCVLEHDSEQGLVAVMLTEVEAYEGRRDPASHAYRGRTSRNAVMFGPPGHAYVYFTYGMHFCVNLVCLPEGAASAVLLRAGRVVAGAELAASRRWAVPAGGRPAGGRSAGGRPAQGRPAGGSPAQGAGDSAREAAGGRARPGRDLARGPARLCQALAVDRSLDGADVCDPGSPLRVRPADGPAGRDRVSRGPRVGVSAAADRLWRFWLTGEATVSAYRAHAPRRRRASAPAAAPPGSADGGGDAPFALVSRTDAAGGGPGGGGDGAAAAGGGQTGLARAHSDGTMLR